MPLGLNRFCTRRRRLKSAAGLVALLVALGIAPAGAQVNVLTQHNDNFRTGANPAEITLTTSNVNVATFGKIFTRSVDDIVLAQPLYVSNLTISGASHNVVFVATENNSVYAFDADDPNASTPLWQVSLGTAVPGSKINGGGYSENGVTCTPVIDLSTDTMYLVAMTIDNLGNEHHFLHALDITTGQDKPDSPVEITGSVAGTNPEDSVGGIVTFNPAQQMIRPAILLANGVLYIGSASHNDFEPYHGWLFAYNAATLQQGAVFNTTPNGSEGGIWQSGDGIVGDASGDIFLSVGNSAEATENASGDYGESLLRLRLAGNELPMVDFFEPNDYDMLNADDLDVGSGGLLEMPDLGLIAGGGKAGVLYIAQKANLGGLSLGGDRVYQEFQAVNDQILASPVYWNNTSTGPTVYVWGDDDFLKAYSMGTGSTFATSPSSRGSILIGRHGAALSISASGSSAGTGIVWGAGLTNSNDTPFLAAYDATNLHLLWTSQQNAARDATQSLAQWVPPTIANGKVYLPNSSGQLLVYGLLPSAVQSFTLSGSPSAINVAPNAQATCVITINPQNGFNGSVTLAANGLPAGVTAAFTPLTATTQQLTLTASPSEATGYTQFSVTGTAGALQSIVNLRLYVSPQVGVVLGAGLQMFSAPYDCSAVSLSQLFGAPETLAAWSPVSSQYALSPTSPADAVRLGQGYWVRLSQQTVLSNLGAPADTATDFSIPLGTGWNQIGNPFLAATTVGAMQFSINGAPAESFATATTGIQHPINSQLWGYDPSLSSGKGAYYPLASTDSLVPGQGYWIDVLSSGTVTLVVPHP